MLPAIFAAKKENKSIRDYVNTKLEEITKRDNVFQNLFPELELITTNEKETIVRDNNVNEFYTLKFNKSDNLLYCDTCKEEELCKHVIFSMGSSRVWGEGIPNG